jgi:acetolactate synthase I/II/III large subunit
VLKGKKFLSVYTRDLALAQQATTWSRQRKSALLASEEWSWMIGHSHRSARANRKRKESLMPRPRTADGGALVARTLKEFGVEVAFGLHGGHLDSLLVGFRNNDVRLIDTRHEAVAVNAADGYARATGRLGVAFATAASGYSNAIAGLATAYADRSPVLLLTSSPPLRDAEQNALQGSVDQVAMAAPVSKWSHRVTVVEEIPSLISFAVRKALAGPPGPVVLDLPIDVLFRPADEARIDRGGGTKIAAPPAPAPHAVGEALTLLRAADRPAIVAGGGVRGARASELLVAFAERSGIPVFNQLTGFGAMPADHPLNGFAAGNLGVLNVVNGKGADVVLLLGARRGMFLGGRSGTIIPESATVIQVDVDSAEIGRFRPFEVGITADSAETLRALLDADGGARWPDRRAWAEAAVLVHRRERPWASEPTVIAGRLHPYHALRETLRALEPGATLIVDGGEMGSWVDESAHEARPRRIIGFGGYLGFLGIGFGLAIGAQVAEPDRRVVLLMGDGAFGLHPQELDTMARHRLPIVTVVVNNACWGMSIHGQQAVYGADAGIISRLADTNYDEVARGLGAAGERVSRLADVGPTIRRALECGKPACVNLTVSGEITHPITPMMVGYTDDPETIVIPYYDNVPRR